MKNTLKKILGENAYNNGLNFQVLDEVSKLVKAVNYQSTQMRFLKDYVSDDAKDEFDEYIKIIEKNTIEILED